MPVALTDLIFWGSANMQDTDSGTQGGALSSSRQVVFSDISPNGTIQFVCDSGDTVGVAVTGRDAAGVIQTDSKALTGVTPVAGTVTFERLLKAQKLASANGVVAVEAVTFTRSLALVSGSTQACALDAGASAVDDFYKDQVIRCIAGIGSAQIRRIVSYNGTTKVAIVDQPWNVNPAGSTAVRISQGFVFPVLPTQVMEIRRPFYNAAADASGGSSRDYYEKIFVKNHHASLALTTAVISENADPAGRVTFALVNSLDDTGSAADRRTVPTNVTTFDSASKAVVANTLGAAAAQGIWLKLTLPAGDPANKTSYTPRIGGQTV